MEWRGWVISLVGLTVLGCGGAVQERTEGSKPARRPLSRALVVTEIDQAEVVNRKPSFLSVAPLKAREGRVYTYDISTVDPDGDEVRYTLVAAPEGAVLEGHALKWVPRPAQAGHHQGFTLRAVDEWGASQDQTWEVTPTEASKAPEDGQAEKEAIGGSTESLPLPFSGKNLPFGGKAGVKELPAT